MNELEKQVVEHTGRIKVLEKRVDKVEMLTESVNKLALSVEKIALTQGQMLEEQKAQRKDIDEIRIAPSKTARDLRNKIISSVVTTLVGALVGALIATIIK